MHGESEKDMEITVNEFLGMAFDNTFEFVVYDFATNKNIFDSTVDEELSDDIGEIYVESWNIINGILELNISSDNEN